MGAHVIRGWIQHQASLGPHMIFHYPLSRPNAQNPQGLSLRAPVPCWILTHLALTAPIPAPRTPTNLCPSFPLTQSVSL